MPSLYPSCLQDIVWLAVLTTYVLPAPPLTLSSSPDVGLRMLTLFNMLLAVLRYMTTLVPPAPLASISPPITSPARSAALTSSAR
jgi:hypothetical protein